ncbi:MAG: AraC family transcriptional regulator [Paracoccaceae bacterium]
MDALGDLFDGPRARGAFALRAVMRPPWALCIAAESPLEVIAVVSGEAWVLPDDGAPVRLGPGDIAVARGPDHYTIADAPDTAPQVVVHPGQRCCDLQGNSLHDAMMHGVRTWGNDPEGQTVFLVGAYEGPSEVSTRLRRALPPILTLKGDDWKSPLVPLLRDEVAKDEPGQAAVLDRLLDLLLIAVLKEWFARPEAREAARAQGDLLVARALKAMHRDPAHPWTLESLASEIGASRASLARRFNEVVGEPPMTFLKNWRLSLAADLLCDPGESVGTVAEKVGYSSPFAFSAAFKRVRGVSPQEHRAGARSPG